MNQDDAPRSSLTGSAKFRATGQRVGKYRLATKLGAGGMGSVYLAYDDEPGAIRRPVAIKLMHPHLAEEQKYVEMFLDEGEIATRLDHPLIVRVLDFGHEADMHFIAMEYLVGEPLSSVMSITDLTQKPTGHAAIVIRIISDLCEGLHAAHELKSPKGTFMQVVHRDISPQNLFVLYDGTVRLIDFGVARKVGKMHQSTTGVLRGKFAYMAPEQLRAGTVDRRSDVWALGVILWELLTGKRLFEGESHIESVLAVDQQRIPLPSEEDPSLPPELDAILFRALERDPSKRYPTARAFGRELLKILYKQPEPIGQGEVAEWMTRLFPDGPARHRVLLQQIAPDSIAPPPMTEPSPTPDDLPIALRSGRSRATTEPSARPIPIADMLNRASLGALPAARKMNVSSRPSIDLATRPVASSGKMNTAIDIRDRAEDEAHEASMPSPEPLPPRAHAEPARKPIGTRNYALAAGAALAIALGVHNYSTDDVRRSAANRASPTQDLPSAYDLSKGPTAAPVQPAVAPVQPTIAPLQAAPVPPTPAPVSAAVANTAPNSITAPAMAAPTIAPPPTTLTPPESPQLAQPAPVAAAPSSLAAHPNSLPARKTSHPAVEDLPPAAPMAVPTTGTVRVTSKVVEEVFVAGRSAGRTPLTLTLPVGRQEFEVRHVGGTSGTKVVVEVDPHKPVFLSLSPDGQ